MIAAAAAVSAAENVMESCFKFLLCRSTYEVIVEKFSIIGIITEAPKSIESSWSNYTLMQCLFNPKLK